MAVSVSVLPSSFVKVKVTSAWWAGEILPAIVIDSPKVIFESDMFNSIVDALRVTEI